jgi:hypothetical protein
MATRSLDRLLTQLEQCRYRFGAGEGTRVVRLLSRLSRQRFADVPSLIRFHEALLFLRAFPHGLRVVRKSEELLRSFAQRVEQLQQAGADMASARPLRLVQKQEKQVTYSESVLRLFLGCSAVFLTASFSG